MAYPSTGPAAGSDTLPQSLCHDAHLGLDRSGGVQADVFSVARPNELHAHGVAGHETDWDDSGWEAKDVDRRHEPQVVPEQRTDARIAAEIGIRLRRPLYESGVRITGYDSRKASQPRKTRDR